MSLSRSQSPSAVSSPPIVFRCLSPPSGRFVVGVRAAASGPVLNRAPASPSSIVEVAAEIWRDGFLRRGFPDFPLDEVSFQMRAVLRDAGSRACVGFVVEAVNPSGLPLRRVFGIDLFQNTALRIAEQLVGEGRLAPNAVVHYDVLAANLDGDAPTPREVASPATLSLSDCGHVVGHIERSSPPLSYLRVPLDAIRPHAECRGVIDPDAFAVFYTHTALERAERFSRRGAGRHPPVESGAVLVGWLCACPRSGEFFIIVQDALEASDAAESSTSLCFTARTWTRLESVMRSRRRHPHLRRTRILGQAHGHPHLPGSTACAACEKMPTCSSTSVYLSRADGIWIRNVFYRQPWHVSHVFGLDARGRNAQGLFSLQNNRFVERGYQVLSDFDPQPFDAGDSNPSFSSFSPLNPPKEGSS